MSYNFLDILSIIIGWTYFSLWCFSFYFLSWEIYKLADVSGLSINFLIINIVGYICYSISNLSGYFQKDSPIGTTHLEDVLFALHGFLFCLIQMWQYKLYRNKNDKNQYLHKYVIYNHIVLVLLCFLVLILQWTNVIDPASKYISILVFLGYIKIYITLLKYTPQIYLHFKRKSTIGWSINNTWCDFLGGLLSLIQILVDCINSGNWNIFINDNTPLNIAKFSLGFVTIVYDLIIMFQHYVLYKDKWNIKYKVSDNNGNGINDNIDADINTNHNHKHNNLVEENSENSNSNNKENNNEQSKDGLLSLHNSNYLANYLEERLIDKNKENNLENKEDV